MANRSQILAILLQLAIWFSEMPLTAANGALPMEKKPEASCKIRCGVLVEERGAESLQDLVSSVWDEIRSSSSLDEVQILFETTEQKVDMTMDSLIEAFIEIGTANVSAVIGLYVQPVLTATLKHGIPYFLMGEHGHDQFTPYNLISVRPRPYDLYTLTVDIVRIYNWTSVAVIYERPHGSLLIESLVRSPSVQVRGWMVNSSLTAVQARDMLLQIRNLDIQNVIVTCSVQASTVILDMALGLSMLSNRHTWILPTLNETGSMVGDYSYSGVNLMTYQLVVTRSPPKKFHMEQFTATEYATIYDSLLALYHGVRLHYKETGRCSWVGKTDLMDKLTKIHVPGSTGNVSFREDGSRNGFMINVLGLDLQGLRQIGTWNSSTEDLSRLKISDGFPMPLPITSESQVTQTFKVIVVEEAPFVMLKVDHVDRLGNDKYYGYAIDLLNAMSDLHQFVFEVLAVPDGQFGSRTVDGAWNGMVRYLLEGNSSIALALPITSSREEVIDFTVPFHVSGISILLPRHQTAAAAAAGHLDRRTGGGGEGVGWLLHFCQPLSSVVWLLLLTALSVVTANVYIVERLSPHPHPSPTAATAASRALVGDGGPSTTASVPIDDDPAALTTDSHLTLQDTVWFTVSAILLRHSSVCPRTVAGRIATTGLHLFSLVVMLSYAANMAALLTSSRRHPPTHHPPSSSSALEPRTLRELLERRDFRFSTVRQSDVSALLEGSADPNVRRIWERIKDSPAGFVDRPQLGRGAVGGHDRCFVWDSAPVRYAVAQNCGLVAEMVVVADTKRYALGVPQGAVYRDRLNMAILTLLEKGTLHALQNKWLSSGDCDRRDDVMADETDGYHGDGGLQLDEMGGVFLLFVVFVVVSMTVSIVEYCHHQNRIKGTCVPPDEPRPRASGNCSSSSSNRASPRHDVTPSALLHDVTPSSLHHGPTDESASMNSSKSFDMSAYHHPPPQQQHQHHHRQHPYAYTKHHNRQTNIF